MRKGTMAALAGLGLALGACSPGDGEDFSAKQRPTTIVEAETRVDAVPQEEPAVARSQWRAISDQARAVTGNLRVSLAGARGGPVVFAFANGITIHAQPFNVAPADSRSGAGGQSFAAVMGGDPRVDAYLYRVIREDLISARESLGGLCGTSPTRHMAVSEFVDGTGRWVFKIAAFRGETQPGSREDPQVCGAFAYTAQ